MPDQKLRKLSDQRTHSRKPAFFTFFWMCVVRGTIGLILNPPPNGDVKTPIGFVGQILFSTAFRFALIYLLYKNVLSKDKERPWLLNLLAAGLLLAIYIPRFLHPENYMA